MNDLLLPLLNEIKPWPCKAKEWRLESEHKGKFGNIELPWTIVMTVQLHSDGIHVSGFRDSTDDEWFDYCDPLLIDKLRATARRELRRELWHTVDSVCVLPVFLLTVISAWMVGTCERLFKRRSK